MALVEEESLAGMGDPGSQNGLAGLLFCIKTEPSLLAGQLLAEGLLEHVIQLHRGVHS